MLTSKVVRRVDLEKEPGEWVEVRMPSMLILDQVFSQKESSVGYGWNYLLEQCVLRWSYKEKVTPENIADLDQATVQQITAVLFGETSPVEKNS